MQEALTCQGDPKGMHPQGSFATPAFTGQSWDGKVSQHPSQYNSLSGHGPQAYMHQQQIAPPVYGSMEAPPPLYSHPCGSFSPGGPAPLLGAADGAISRRTRSLSVGGHSSAGGGASFASGHPGGLMQANNPLSFTQVQAFPCLEGSWMLMTLS
jgi:hypothetical protein